MEVEDKVRRAVPREGEVAQGRVVVVEGNHDLSKKVDWGLGFVEVMVKEQASAGQARRRYRHPDA